MKRASRVLMWLAAATILAPAGSVGGGLRIERSRTFVRSYTVQDGIAVPITHVITDRITIGDVIERRPSRKDEERYYRVDTGEVPTRRSSARERRALAEFLDGYRQDVQRAAAGPAEAATAAAGPNYVDSVPLPRSGPKTVTMFGTVRAMEDGLAFLVTRGQEEVIYLLDGADSVRDLLQKSGSDVLPVVIVGKVVEGGERPLLRVESVWERTFRPSAD